MTVDIAVHEWGGDGAPVLLAHATGFHGRIWAPIARRLIEAGRHVWSFDFRGHGDSDAPDTDYAWGDFATDVATVAERIGVAGDPALLACGHSKGGTALLLAEERAPGMFAGIWTYEPVMFATEDALAPDPDNPLSVGARKRRNEWPSIEAAYSSYSSKPPLNVFDDDTLRAYVEYGLRDRGDGVFVLKCDPQIEARVYTMAPANGAFAKLKGITAPVLVACGHTTDAVPPVLAERIVERLPHGYFEVWEGRGHFGPQEDPERTAASILAFTDRTRA